MHKKEIFDLYDFKNKKIHRLVLAKIEKIDRYHGVLRIYIEVSL